MIAQILNGKQLSEQILQNLKQKIQNLNLKPRLSIIICGEDKASQIYVNMKKNKAESIGINAEVHQLLENVSQKQVIELIKKLNNSSDGIIVQMPLPKHLDNSKIINTIDSNKDVDGLTNINLGEIFTGKEFLVPATPKGIIRLLEHYKISIHRKHAVVVGRSNLLGKPIASLLLNKNATVTICHRHTQNLKEYTEQADILVLGIGKANFIKQDMIKQDAVIIDAGITKIENKIYGDADFQNIKEKASYITPVPGGVGPMTVAMLLENVVEVCERK